MKSVIITMGTSSAIMYYQECLYRNLLPVFVNPPSNFGEELEIFRKKVKDKALCMDMKSDDEYGEILEKVRKLDPVCVVCGSAGGVFLADRLARDLGLKGNDPETTWRRDSKEGMYESLKEAGIRCIAQKTVRKESDIDDFWKEVDPKKAVMKYSNSAGSVGLIVCHSREEAKSNLPILMQGVNDFGFSDDVIIQEYIEGEEYVINTVSCDGVHALTDIWKHKKHLTKDNAIIYDHTDLIVNPSPGVMKMVGYMFKVLDAEGFRYGPCHGELKVDDKGPVLIETNPRPMGASMSADYLDDCLSHHVTDIALDAFLDPERFRLYAQKYYLPKKYAAHLAFISPKECDINLGLMNFLLSNTESYYESTVDFDDRVFHTRKTVDLETSPFMLKFVNKDYETMVRDMEVIRSFERDFFDLLLEENRIVEASSEKPDIDRYLSAIPLYHNTMVMTDDEEYLVKYGERREKGGVVQIYDTVLFALCGRMTLAEKFSRMKEAIDRMASCGIIIFPPQVWEKIPYGSSAVEFVLRIAGCRIHIRNSDLMHSVIGYKG